jgi:hypothetical protein
LFHSIAILLDKRDLPWIGRSGILRASKMKARPFACVGPALSWSRGFVPPHSGRD